MLNTKAIEQAESRFAAARAVEQHLHCHGAGLCNLLDVINDPSGLAAFYDLHDAINAPLPYTDAIEAALKDICRVLADQPQSSLDQLGVDWCLPVSDMNRWHGARASELLARFSGTECDPVTPCFAGVLPAALKR